MACLPLCPSEKLLQVWDLSACVDNGGRTNRMPSKPTYTLHTSYRIRRVAWRPESQTEIAVAPDAPSSSVISTSISSTGAYSDNSPSSMASIMHTSPQSATNSSPRSAGSSQDGSQRTNSLHSANPLRANMDELEIWDVRRSWVSKWTVEGSSVEGGISGECTNLLGLCKFYTRYYALRYGIRRFFCDLGNPSNWRVFAVGLAISLKTN